MIRVDRGALTPAPEVLKRSERATQDLLHRWSTLGAQQRLEFKFGVWAANKPLLVQLFHGKCAFCESPLLATAHGDVEHFRPKLSVEEDPRHPGYYWLAYEWTNLYLVCQVCNVNKRNHFPIAATGSRAYTPEDALELERPLLLDPCIDTPESHLRFLVDGDESGMVVPLSDSESGRVTIETLGLNRVDLIQARAQEVRNVRAQIDVLALVQPLDERIEKTRLLLQPSHPYLAARREVISQFAPWLAEPAAVKPPSRRRRKGVVPPAEEPGAGLAPAKGKKPRPVTAQPQVARPSSSRSGYIRHVEIKNFRAIESLDLTFEFARANRTGWQVFLGENGTGKSTILQAIGLALIGQQNLAALGLDARSILRLPHEEEAPPVDGFIKVWLSTDPDDPIEVTFDGGEIKHTHGPEGANIFVRGYGPTRLLPRKQRASQVAAASASVPPDSGAVRDAPEAQPADAKRAIDNLFDPYVPLCDAPAWLARLDEDSFNKAALTIKDILRFRNEDNLVFDRESGEVKTFDANGIPVALNLLSHGQQCALVLAADIVSGIMADRVASNLPAVPGDFQESAGIILLDEIDAHLHPRWKMEIVPSLKRAFPFIQFIATTHEPLCLRGLEEREIVIMRRDDAGITAEVTPISPKGWRVDQLLTSELFGLFSTIDPDVDAEFQEYYFLLSKRESDLTEPERTRLEHLRNTLRRHNRLGYTRRDQLLYEVIDDYLVKELQERSHEKRTQLRDETKRALHDMWQRVVAARDQPP